MIKIVVIDDQKRDMEQITSILSAQKEFSIAGSGKDGYDALRLSAQVRPDVIIMTLEKNNREGPELVPLIKRKSPAAGVIFLSRLDDNEHIVKALSSGALGYLLKQSDMDKLAISVQTVYNGGSFISPLIITRIFGTLLEQNRYRNTSPPAPRPRQILKGVPASIKRKELQIMASVAQGHSTKVIAEKLRLKQGTVRNYLSSAIRKAGLENRSQVISYAIINDLIDTGEATP
jgi:DNA-binding NarL/FixJ family response regulator